MSATVLISGRRNACPALAHVGLLGAALHPTNKVTSQVSCKLNPDYGLLLLASCPLPALLFWKITYESRRQILQSV